MPVIMNSVVYDCADWTNKGTYDNMYVNVLICQQGTISCDTKHKMNGESKVWHL